MGERGLKQLHVTGFRISYLVLFKFLCVESCQADMTVPWGAAMLDFMADAKVVMSEDLNGFDC